MNIDAIKKYHQQLGEALENLSNAEAQMAKLNAGTGVGIKIEIRPKQTAEYLGLALDDDNQIGFELLASLDREYRNIAFSAENDIKQLLLKAPRVYVDAQFVDTIPF